eukprot:CAMPEP_0174338050 /NCGR_PEP_ID=MMETSP0810-20121108/22842_1 /TAXON_ID=73025 ORGANISM="Eutreptiella gymnastica-like, Strain CCMP1594" /NCGR_SAMPLE_ID=MMETSP0810 /ASSEMBLY_ACC=CAM_ASM_000659 /LENGTH=562 /DNA_ID=CAMNT_0015457935 /DNA_START=173 /DNA_END=1861 /DNA_ORIENTATION=-
MYYATDSVPTIPQGQKVQTAKAHGVSTPKCSTTSDIAGELGDAGRDNSSQLDTCECSGTTHHTGRNPQQMADWMKDLEKQATVCNDDIVKKRMGIAMMSNVLAQCALKWLDKHAQEHLQPERPQVLMDYTHDAMEYPFAKERFRNWLQLMSFLPQDSLAMPERKGATPNQVLLGTPILHRLRSWFATSTFVDVQLALRFDEAATYATPIDPLELMAKIVSMGRVTYLVLSCTPFSDMTDIDAVKKAAESIPDPKAPLGVHRLEVKVESLAVFKYKTCTKELLKVTNLAMDKTGRAKWCYYPSPHFGWFSMKYAGNELKVTDRSTGQLVDTKHESGLPYVPMSEILGWGVVRDTREFWFGHFATHKICDQMVMHNVVMLAGGEFGCRPTLLNLPEDHAGGRPEKKHYLAYLQLLTCTGHGLKWKLQYPANSTEVAYFTTQGANELKFSNSLLYRQSHGSWKVATSMEQAASVFQDDSGKVICASECLQCYGNFTTIDDVVPECVECNKCLARKKQHHFLAQSFVGCNDVDGVNENGVLADYKYRCYDIQTEPKARPTTHGQHL